jgi:hypothetical protein
MGHVLLSALHRTTPVQEKTVEPQIPVLAFVVNEKHSQSRLYEHGVRSELHAVKLHVAVVLPERENIEKIKEIII